jgi:hypothetical protein
MPHRSQGVPADDVVGAVPVSQEALVQTAPGQIVG